MSVLCCLPIRLTDCLPAYVTACLLVLLPVSSVGRLSACLCGCLAVWLPLSLPVWRGLPPCQSALLAAFLPVLCYQSGRYGKQPVPILWAVRRNASKKPWW